MKFYKTQSYSTDSHLPADSLILQKINLNESEPISTNSMSLLNRLCWDWSQIKNKEITFTDINASFQIQPFTGGTLTTYLYIENVEKNNEFSRYVLKIHPLKMVVSGVSVNVHFCTRYLFDLFFEEIEFCYLHWKQVETPLFIYWLFFCLSHKANIEFHDKIILIIANNLIVNYGLEFPLCCLRKTPFLFK